MKDRELEDGLECFTTRVVDEQSRLGNGDDHLGLEQVVDEPKGGVLVDVRLRPGTDVSILCQELGFEPVAIVRGVIEGLRTCHGKSR